MNTLRRVSAIGFVAIICMTHSGCDFSPKPYLEFIDIPGEMEVGKTSQIVLMLTNVGWDMKSNDNGIMDVTFVGDVNVLVTIAGGDVWEKPGVYAPGTTIYHKETGPMTARDLLVSPESTGWKQQEKKRLVLNVTPRKRGILKVCAGSVFVLNTALGVQEVRHPEQADYINQQGHPCMVAEIRVK